MTRMLNLQSLQQLVKQGEGPTLEFKQKANFPDKIVREMFKNKTKEGLFDPRKISDLTKENIIKRLDEVLQEFEQIIGKGDEEFLKSWAGTIANVSTHNAYHTGQIIFVRKLQGSWNPDKGVK